MKLKYTCSLERYDKPRQHKKKRWHHFADKATVFPVKAEKPSSQSYGFSSSHEWMWELNHKEGWVLKNWCFWTVVLEKIFESPFDCKEIKPLSPEGNETWIFIGRTDAEAPTLWPSDVKSNSLEKTLMLGKNLPAMRETWVQSLGWEDPLEEGKATTSRELPWWLRR